MNKTVSLWGPVFLALALAGVGLLSRGQGWGWAGRITAAAVILPILGGIIWASLKKNPEEAPEQSNL